MMGKKTIKDRFEAGEIVRVQTYMSKKAYQKFLIKAAKMRMTPRRYAAWVLELDADVG